MGALWFPENLSVGDSFIYTDDGNVEVWTVDQLEMLVCPRCKVNRPVYRLRCAWSARNAILRGRDEVPAALVDDFEAVARAVEGAWEEDISTTCLVCGHAEEGGEPHDFVELSRYLLEKERGLR